MTEGTGKSLHPEVRAALIIIFQLGKSPPPCPEYLVEIGPMVIPELLDQTNFGNMSVYQNFRARLKTVPRKISPLYGNHAAREEQKWDPEDLQILRMLKERWQHHQVVAHLTEFMARRPR